MYSFLDINYVTAISTFFLVIVGITQARIFGLQNRQNQLIYIEEYRKRWKKIRIYWGIVIFIGRDDNEYYQIVNKKMINKFKELENDTNSYEPSIWALDANKQVFSLLNDICIQILKNQLKVSDIYPIFGTEFLRNTQPLKVLLDIYTNGCKYNTDAHNAIRYELQDWLIYHDAIRRRSLILIDLLWAEATRLEELPPYDIIQAANRKKNTGYLNRNRIYTETIKLNGLSKYFLAIKFSRFLRYSEYKKFYSNIGIDKSKIDDLDNTWTKKLLRT